MKSVHLFLAAAVALSAPVVAEAQTKPGAGGGSTINLRVCNRSGRDATVAVSYVQPGESRFINRGWYDVANGACRALVSTENLNFYFYADATDGSGRYWKGNHTLCVEYPGPYTFYSSSSSQCTSGQETRDFSPFRAEGPGDWTWNLDP